MFVNVADPWRPLVGKLLAGRRQEQPTVADAVPRAYLTRVVAAFERAGLALRPSARRGAVVVAGLLEPLSARELEVLGLLGASVTTARLPREALRLARLPGYGPSWVPQGESSYVTIR